MPLIISKQNLSGEGLSTGRNDDSIVVLDSIADDKVARIGLFVHKRLRIYL